MATTGRKASTQPRRRSTIRARSSPPKRASRTPSFMLDPESLNPTFTYTRRRRRQQRQDGRRAACRLDAGCGQRLQPVAAGEARGIRGAALWFLGAEDPSLWILSTRRTGIPTGRRSSMRGGLDTITYGGAGADGLRGRRRTAAAPAAPSDGKRTVHVDPKTGLITAEAYQTAIRRRTATAAFLVCGAALWRRAERQSRKNRSCCPSTMAPTRPGRRRSWIF